MDYPYVSGILFSSVSTPARTTVGVSVYYVCLALVDFFKSERRTPHSDVGCVISGLGFLTEILHHKQGTEFVRCLYLTGREGKERLGDVFG